MRELTRLAPTTRGIICVAIGLTALGSHASASPQDISSVSIFGGWSITIEPSGRATAQYGSILGDCGFVPTGTVDFAAFVLYLDEVQRKAVPEAGDLQVAIHLEGANSATAFALSDASYLEDMLVGLDAKWQQCPGGMRFFELKERCAIVVKPDRAAGTTTPTALQRGHKPESEMEREEETAPPN